MRVLSVIDRELRAAARHSFTYSMRILGVLALLLVLGSFCLRGDLGPEMGAHLFGLLHATLFFAIWLLVPLLTADCISRERREGTLPLLFLTNLNPREIVYAKGFAHGLRACTLWLAVWPLLVVPLVGGGVGWREVVLSALVNLSALSLAISAGLCASAGTRVWSRAMALAALLATVFLFGMIALLPAFLLPGRPGAIGWLSWFRDQWGPLFGLGVALDWEGLWQQWLAGRFRRTGSIFVGFGLMACVSFIFLWITIRFAAWRVRVTWREQPASARMQWLERKLFSPVFFQRTLRRWLNWQLARNPIGWLGQRSWVGRVVVWSWFAVVVCLYSSLFANLGLYQRGFNEVQMVVSWLLAGSIALSAAGSFRRERDSGTMELLLVSPITESQIIGGRVRGLWTQFAPAVALLLSVWIYSGTFMTDAVEVEVFGVVSFGVCFLTFPVIGLYFSLAKSNYISALIWTLLAGILVPAVVGYFVRFWADPLPQTEVWLTSIWPLVARLTIAALLFWRLHERLRFRRFDFVKRG